MYLCRMSKGKPSNRKCKGAAYFQDQQTGRFKKGLHWREHKAFREKDYLMREYVTNGRSTGDIAIEWGVTDAAIFWWMRKHEIPRRSVSEARSLKKWGLTGSANGMYGKCGDKNPRWIDGSAPLRQTMYARSFWKEIAKTVYERDGYLCQRCGLKHSKQNRLHAHHVKPWAGNPNFRFDTNNIITLCRDCHTWVHSKQNTANEFLSR